MIHKQIVVPSDSAAPRLLPFLRQAVPGLAAGQIYRALRRKDIRLNGRRIQADQRIAAGDIIDLFLAESDAELAAEAAKTAAREAAGGAAVSRLPVLYQDDAIVIISKPAGLPVHGTAAGDDEAETLIARARRQLNDPGLLLGHRLDRNTAGLILLARSPAIQQELQAQMRAGHIIKRYRCLVRGEPQAGHPVQATDGTVFFQIEGYLEKRARQKEVFIHDQARPGDVPVITRYRILRRFPGLGPAGETVSELEVELVTGRTHQIRAHLAHLGHPLLGDGKYGRNSYNRTFQGYAGPLSRQQLAACQLIFDRSLQSGPLAHLAGKVFQIQPEYDLALPEAAVPESPACFQ
jgi:23S rRNA pseudouridine955/2504/2580 synthase